MQFGNVSLTSRNITVNLSVSYSNYEVVITPYQTSLTYPSSTDTFCVVSKASSSFSVSWNNHANRNWKFSWFTIGY